MWVRISDVLFMASLGLLVLALLMKGAGSGMFGRRRPGPDGDAGEMPAQRDGADKRPQDSLARRLLKSYVIWIALAGIAVSILMTL